MRNLYDKEAVEEIKKRISILTEKSKAKWGKMDVAQMLAHCTAGLEMALGDRFIPRNLIGRIIGPLLKSNYYNDKPFPKNIKTPAPLKIISQRRFQEEQKQLIATIERFYNGGPNKATTNPHPIFGTFTPMQWAMGMYKHLDYHLNQFEV